MITKNKPTKITEEKQNLKPKVIKTKMFGEAFEEELKDLIDLRIEESNKKKISLEDLNEIAKLLVGDVDKLISEKVKLHLKFLGEKLIDLAK